MAKQSKKDSKTSTPAAPAEESMDIDLTRSSSIPPPPDASEVETQSAVEPEAPPAPSAGDQGKVVHMGATADVVESEAEHTARLLALAELTKAEAEAEVVHAPAPEGSRLAKYQAGFPLGGTFFMPGGKVGLTVTDMPFEDADGKIHVACVKHTGVVANICIDGLLD